MRYLSHEVFLLDRTINCTNELFVEQLTDLSVLIVCFLGVLIAVTGTFISRLSHSEQAAISARDEAIELQQEAERAQAETAESLRALQAARNEQARLTDMFSTRLLEDSQSIYEGGLLSKGTQAQFAEVKVSVEGEAVTCASVDTVTVTFAAGASLSDTK